MNQKIKKILKNLPSEAWIYQFFNNKWEIIYIWKSVNLKSRVNSYFNWKAKLNFAKQKMVEQIADIKYILVENETESLILETNLIKKHLPKYNILMKDWKNHIYIKITDEEYPKIIKTRKKTKDWEYFWPYISSQDIDNILKVIKKIFGYWVWEHNFFKNKNSYNLDKYLFEWNNVDIFGKNIWEKEIKKLYLEKLEEIKKFLKWDYKQVIEKLREKMMNFARNQEFERANIIKKQIESIEALNEKQIVREGIIWDFNVINYLEKYDKIFIWKIEIRDSKIIWFYPYEIENNLWESIEKILENFVKQEYLNSILENSDTKKPTLIISKKIELKEKIFEKIKIEVPKKWTKLDLLKMCYKNIYEFAYKKHLASLSTKRFTKQTMKNLLHILWFERINKDIIFECNDISHISWNYTVASRSVIENWKTNPSKYRKFKIKTLKEWEINDFDSMREIAKRRILELEKLWNYPDLIIIDWGKAQLSSVYETVEMFGKNISKNETKKRCISNTSLHFNKKIQLVWIAKKEEILYVIEPKYPSIPANHPSSPFLEGENISKSYIFKEIKLKKDSLELRLIQKIRDEAHRFAIWFNRDSRIKANKKNILESLPWIWPKTRKKILNKYWSLENLANTNKEELKKFLWKKVFEILENHGII